MGQVGERKEEISRKKKCIYKRRERGKHGGEMKCIYIGVKKTSVFYLLV